MNSAHLAFRKRSRSRSGGAIPSAAAHVVTNVVAQSHDSHESMNLVTVWDWSPNRLKFKPRLVRKSNSGDVIMSVENRPDHEEAFNHYFKSKWQPNNVRFPTIFYRRYAERGPVYRSKSSSNS